MDLEHLSRILESLLFVADEPLSLGELSELTETEPEAIEKAMAMLQETLRGRGLMAIRSGDSFQLDTIPESTPFVERYLGDGHHNSLSAAALETLAIIAYRQPITRAQIDAIRGVDSAGVTRTLLARSLIRPLGRLQQAGRPMVLGTTFEFLEYFGLESLDELPPLPDFEDVEIAALDAT